MPTTTNLPFRTNVIAVINLTCSTSFHKATFFSGICQSRILPSNEPEIK